MKQRALTILVTILLVACDDGNGNPADGGADARHDADGDQNDAAPDSDEPDADQNDAAPDGDQHSGTWRQGAITDCDFGVGQWTGGDYQHLDTARHEFQVQGGVIKLWLVRFYVEPGIGESYIYDVQAIGIERDGMVACIDDAAALEYTNTHHNWGDAVTAVTDDVTWTWQVSFDIMNGTGFNHTLAAEDGSGDVVLAEVELERTGGPAN